MGTILGTTYGSILGLLGVAALECDAVALMLETLWGDKTLDLWCLGVWLLALTLWLDFTSDDELADLRRQISLMFCSQIRLISNTLFALSRTGIELRIYTLQTTYLCHAVDALADR